MIKGLPYQRGGFKNYIWINNGYIESLVSKHTILTVPWIIGRLNQPNLSHMKNMARRRHTIEKDKQHSDTMKGRIQIIKDDNCKRIKKIELLTYQKEGWIKGTIKTKNSIACIINGQHYNSIGRAASDLNILVETVRYRLKSSTNKWMDYHHKPSINPFIYCFADNFLPVI